MSDKVKVTAFATVEREARTLGDLRELVKWCDEHGLPDRLGLDWGSGFVYVEITGDTAVRAEMIECGDHIPPKVMFDVLVPTHYHGPETYEEALEEKLEEKKGMPQSWWDDMGFPRVRKESKGSNT